jgi:hypothetical protein
VKGYIYGKCGQPDKARQYIADLEEASKHQFVFGSRIAASFLGLGQPDSAFTWLEKAIDQRVPISPTETSMDPFASLFKGDPRLIPLLRRRATNARTP